MSPRPKIQIPVWRACEHCKISKVSIYNTPARSILMLTTPQWKCTHKYAVLSARTIDGPNTIPQPLQVPFYQLPTSMSGEPLPITPAAGTGSVAKVEYQSVTQGDIPRTWPHPERLTLLSLKAPPHPDLSPRDLQFLRDHPEVLLDGRYPLERQQRIIEGSRQLLAIQKETENCPVTGRVCGRVGHGPHGIHSECVSLSYE